MHKDTFLASIIGFSIGIVVALVLWLTPQFLGNRNAKSPDLADNANSPITKLTINAPTDGNIVDTKTTKVEGHTHANRMLMISSPIDETVTRASSDGSFAVTIDIEYGDNAIAITQYAPEGTIEDSKILTISYFPSNL